MKQPKTPLLTLSILACAALLPGCGGSTDPTSKAETVPPSSDHVKYLPPDAWMVSTIRLGQMMEKMDYESLVHMPAIAFLYSQLNQDFNVNLDNPREREMAALVTRIIEQPGESTGIDLDRDAYLFLGAAQEQAESKRAWFKTPSLPCFGVVLPLSDRSRFENLIEMVLEESRESDEVKRRSENNVRYYSQADDPDSWLLAIHEELAYLQLSFPGNQFKAEEVKQHLASPAGPPAFLKDMLKRPFDLAVHLNFEGMLETFKPIISEGTDGELDSLMNSPIMAWAKGGSESIELSAEDGRLVLMERATLGENFKYDLIGPAVRNSMLDLLPAESIASASISLNMEGVRRMLIDLQKALGPEMSDDLDLPPLDAQIPGLGLSIDEALSAFSGEITAALIDLPDEDAPRPQRDVPEFVVALSTVDPAGKVYQDILKKKLLALFDKGLRQELREETGISLVAKDNRLIFGSHGQAAILKAGKAPKPVGSDERKLLAGGYLNLHLDAERIAKAISQSFDRDRRSAGRWLTEEITSLEAELAENPNHAQEIERVIAELREELERTSSHSTPHREEEQLIVDAFERLDSLTLQAKKEDQTYLAEVALSLDDKKSNVLKQTGAFIGNFMDPAWRDPEMRPRIVAARKLAAKNPEAFRKSLIGTWSNEWEDEMEVPIEDFATNRTREEGEVPQTEPAPEPEIIHGVNKFVYNADGTSFLRFLTIESEGYYLDQNEGHWVVHGNTLLEYNEHGLVEWVGGMLSHGPKKQEYYYVSEAFEEYELDNMTRVPDDWQLPDPPKGLPKLENPVFEERGEDDWGEADGDGAWSEDAEVEMPREMQREHEDHFRHGDDHGHEGDGHDDHGHDDHGHDGDGHDGGSEFKTSPRAAPEREETITIEELLRRSQELEVEAEERSREPRREKD